MASYKHIGVDQNTFIKSPNQPIRYEIRQTGVGSGIFNQICADVSTEGQSTKIGVSNSYNTGIEFLNNMLIGVRYAIIGLRVKQSARNISVEIDGYSIIGLTTDEILVEIIVGGNTVGIPTWNTSPFSNTEAFTASLDIPGGLDQKIHSGGVSVYSEYLSGEQSSINRIESLRRIGSYIDGTMEKVYLCVTPISDKARACAAFNWTEFI